MTLIERLNLIGMDMTDDQRQNASELANLLRKKNRPVIEPYGTAVIVEWDDDLGELADLLDTLACPIVVTRPRPLTRWSKPKPKDMLRFNMDKP